MAQEEVFVSYSREDNEQGPRPDGKAPRRRRTAVDGRAQHRRCGHVGRGNRHALDKAKVLLLMVSEPAVRSHT